MMYETPYTHIETVLMAHRYLYYIQCAPVISDTAYDFLEREAREKLPADSPIQGVGSSFAYSYSEKVIKMAKELSDQ